MFCVLVVVLGGGDVLLIVDEFEDESDDAIDVVGDGGDRVGVGSVDG